jgi:Sap, sulfolipid-1-addressing protein
MAGLLPLIVGAAVLPLDIFMVLLLLRSEGGVVKAAAFAAGAMTLRLLQGVFFGYVFRATADAAAEEIVASTLLLVVGILLLITAVKTWLREADPDAPPPRWMIILGGVSALTAFGMGTALMAVSIKQWVFTLSAIAIIDEIPSTPGGSVLAYLTFVVAAHSLVLAPVLLAAAAPARSSRLLDAAQAWLERNGRATMLVVSLLLGMWFLWKGITGLLRLDQPVVAKVGAAARLG